MKSAVETLNPTRVKLTVEVTLDELRPSLDAAYRTIGGQIQVPGFRKGKVPQRIIDQRVGRGAVLQEAINEALPGFYRQALTETEVRPLGQPQVEVTAVPEAAGSQLEFTAEVDVRPAIELPDFSTLAVTVDDVEVSDEDVDARLQQLRQRFGTLTAVERPVEAGDVLSLDMTARIGDEEIETVTGHTYEVGSGQLLDGVDEAVTGAAKGDVKEFTTVLAGGDHAGEEADVTVTVVSVKVRELPDADDDFAQLASEFDSLDELTADLRTRAEREKEFEQGVQARDKVLEALLAAVEVPVPDSLVEAEVHQHLENESRLEDDEHRAEVDVEARKALRAQLLLDTIVDRDQVRVGQQELVDYIVAQAPRYGMDPNSFAKAMEQSGQLPSVLAEVARRKALSTVLEQAVITDASGRPVVLTDDEEDGGLAGEVDDVLEDGSLEDDELDADEELADEELADEGLVGERLDDAPAPAATASAAPAQDTDGAATAAPVELVSVSDAAGATDAVEATDVSEQAGGAEPDAAAAEPAPAAPKRTRAKKAPAAE